MTDTPPRIVLDCNVYFSALLSADGHGGRCLRAGREGKAAIFISRHVLAEIRKLPEHPELITKFPTLTPKIVDAFINAEVFSAATLISKVPDVFTYGRDPADARYVSLAVAANATRLVSRDKDLLALMTDHSIEAKQFRQLTRNQLRILTPADFLAELDAAPPRLA